MSWNLKWAWTSICTADCLYRLERNSAETTGRKRVNYNYDWMFKPGAMKQVAEMLMVLVRIIIC